MKKRRHNPDKRVNQPGYENCSYDDGNCCELYMDRDVLKICKGNRHNCIKIETKLNAIRKNK